MKKILFILGILLIAGCAKQMTIDEAMQIAGNSACVDEGPLAKNYIHNNITKTWWIAMAIEKPGCSPACVVDEKTKTAELNWRCTGLAEPDEIVCTADYAPVCGTIQVQCIKAPCPPIKETFSNRCEAEKRKAFDIKEGPCDDKIDSFEDCVDAGNPIMESYPRQCRADGQTFVEEI